MAVAKVKKAGDDKNMSIKKVRVCLGGVLPLTLCLGWVGGWVGVALGGRAGTRTCPSKRLGGRGCLGPGSWGQLLG
jgi:hypothetical protein